MTENTNDSLEQQLASLTRWEGDAPGLWRRALRASGRGMPAWQRLFGVPIPGVAAAAVVLVAIVAGGLMLVYGPDSPMGWARRPDGAVEKRQLQDKSQIRGEPLALAGVEASEAHFARAQTSVPLDVDVDGEVGFLIAGSGSGGAPPTGGVGRRSRVSAPGSPAAQDLPLGVDALEPDRHVVRKATIELETDDVRALFLKAAQLVSEAGGEYVESSSLTGSGREAAANLTLRVRADRLSETLNALRELGTVESEQSSGEDVTAQVVDLEARVRNDQRVEAELLDLLESRQDSPLREILDLRRQLNIVRTSIERLTAQRQRIGRLVTLATILVIIRPADAAPEPEPKAGLGHYFGERMLASWGGGLRLLTNTMAGALRLLVGGLLWWVILTLVLLRLRQYVRQQKMQEAVA